MAEGGRTLPHNLDAERSVLGGILLNPRNALISVMGIITADDFYAPAHQEIYQSMMRLEETGKPIDLITVEEDLRVREKLARVGGAEYLTDLLSAVATIQNILHHAHIVRDKSTLRRLIQTVSEVGAGAYTDQDDVQDFLDGAEQRIFELAQRTTASNYQPIKKITVQVFNTLESRFEKKQAITGVPTGYTDLDRMTAGLQPGDLIILAARPSMGKTALILNIAQNTAMQYHTPVLFFSLEMSDQQLVQRVLCSEARVDSSKLRSGFIDAEEWRSITMAASRISEAPIFIDDSSSPTLLEIRAKARRFKADRSIFAEPDQMGLIVVDYLQLVHSHRTTENRALEVAEISRGLKALAKELRLPIVALSQLRRAAEDRKDGEPQLSDLRESGAIEQDADIVMFIHRDKSEQSISESSPAKLILGKQRNGPIGAVDLMFLSRYTRFENAAKGDFQ